MRIPFILEKCVAVLVADRKCGSTYFQNSPTLDSCCANCPKEIRIAPFSYPSNIPTPHRHRRDSVPRGAQGARPRGQSQTGTAPHSGGGVCGSQRGFVLCFPVKGCVCVRERGCVCETPRRNKFQWSSFVRNCTKLFMNPENSFLGRPKCFGPFRRNNCGFIHEVFSIFEFFMVISLFDTSQ